MPRTAICLTLTAALLAGTLGLAHADVYRWVDKHGVVHYSDQWVPGAKLVMSTTESLQGGGSSQATKGLAAESKSADQLIQKQADERAVQTQEAQLQAQRCKQAQAVYKRLIYARRLFTVDKSGQRHYFSDAKADAARVKAKQTMDKLCGAQSG